MDLRFAVMKGGPKGVLSIPESVEMDIGYEVFSLRVADAFGELRETQELVWKTNRMPQSASWLALGGEKDFSEILRQARQVLEQENASRCRVIEKNAADSRKAKERKKPFVPKDVPVIKEYVILLRDLTQENRLKNKSKASTKVVCSTHCPHTCAHSV